MAALSRSLRVRVMQVHVADLLCVHIMQCDSWSRFFACCFAYTIHDHAIGLSSWFVKLSESPHVLAKHNCTTNNCLCLALVKSECSFSHPSAVRGQQLGITFPDPNHCHIANQTRHRNIWTVIVCDSVNHCRVILFVSS